MLTVSELIRVMRFERSLRDYDARQVLGKLPWEAAADRVLDEICRRLGDGAAGEGD